MTKPTDIENLKAAYDAALGEARKYGDEMLEALEMHEKIQARDTDDVFFRKARRAMKAYVNWTKSADMVRRAMDDYYERGYRYFD